MTEENSDIVHFDMGNGVKMWFSKKEYELSTKFFKEKEQELEPEVIKFLDRLTNEDTDRHR